MEYFEGHRVDASSGAIPPGKEQEKMSEIKLKPCPFCGGEAFCYVSGRIEPEMPDMFWVRCKKCDVVTKSYTTREKAIKKWNRRAGEQDEVKRK